MDFFQNISFFPEIRSSTLEGRDLQRKPWVSGYEGATERLGYPSSRYFPIFPIYSLLNGEPLGATHRVFQPNNGWKHLFASRWCFRYCWPCTFFVPFLAEPFAVQWLPQHLAQYIVGANKKIKGENAEKAAPERPGTGANQR